MFVFYTKLIVIQEILPNPREKKNDSSFGKKKNLQKALILVIQKKIERKEFNEQKVKRIDEAVVVFCHSFEYVIKCV